ncbi:MAG: T9SS type A sorting domain-containing protein [Ignavibacteria bacterium]|nr:T9SS type A sorting domain-containing protein [Ignavibacteria bacterium]
MRTSISLLAVLGIFLLLNSTEAMGQWINGQNADLVLGQSSFTSNAFGLGPDSLFAPTGAVIDPTTGKLFVADIGNNRVLRWASVDSLVSGQPAEAVLGQPDFTSDAKRVTQDGMDFPTAIAIDMQGRLYVSDALNNRVLRYDSASAKPSGANADGVLGQPDFTSKIDTASRSGMNYVRGLYADGDGRLWVSDQRNNRVLRFDNAAAKPNGADADGVLGQPDFLSNAGDTSQSGMSQPRGLVLDDQGRLWVAEVFNHRVLRFDNASAKPNGANADGVLGQPDFTTAIPMTTASGMSGVSGVAIDQSGRLYVGDTSNNRILLFNDAVAKPNGGSADGVLGKPDFVTTTAATTQNGMSGPWGSWVDRVRNTLWVYDTGNNRILRFTATLPLPVEEAADGIPDRFALAQNYPNPFNPSTDIGFRIADFGLVRLLVYDLLGREVAVLVNEKKAPGTYSVQFDASDLGSGVYLYRLQAGNYSETKKLVILR